MVFLVFSSTRITIMHFEVSLIKEKITKRCSTAGRYVITWKYIHPHCVNQRKWKRSSDKRCSSEWKNRPLFIFFGNIVCAPKTKIYKEMTNSLIFSMPYLPWLKYECGKEWTMTHYSFRINIQIPKSDDYARSP